MDNHVLSSIFEFVDQDTLLNLQIIYPKLVRAEIINRIKKKINWKIDKNIIDGKATGWITGPIKSFGLNCKFLICYMELKGTKMLYYEYVPAKPKKKRFFRKDYIIWESNLYGKSNF